MTSLFAVNHQLTKVGSHLSDFSVRLVDGFAPNEGRVEVLYQGVWGTICAESDSKSLGWDSYAAKLVCKQLGYSSPYIYAIRKGQFGASSAPVILSHLDCGSSERTLGACEHNAIILPNNACQGPNDYLAEVSCIGPRGDSPAMPTEGNSLIRSLNCRGSKHSSRRSSVAASNGLVHVDCAGRSTCSNKTNLGLHGVRPCRGQGMSQFCL